MNKRPTKYTGLSKSTLDRMWSEKVKDRAGWKCEICGETSGLSSHHFSARHNHSVRWFLPNGITLCKNCHTSSKNSAHQNPAWFTLEMIKRRSESWLDAVSQQSAKPFAWSKNMDKIREYLEGKIENYI